MRCVFCDRPLTCESCGAEFEPRDREHYEALSRPEVPVVCPGCEEILICHWCKTPYDGGAGESDDS